MTPEDRRRAVKAMLDGNPTLSQRAIAKALGVSQASVRRDMAALGIASVNQPGFVRQRVSPAPAQVNGGDSPMTQVTPDGIAALMGHYCTRGDKLVARLRGEMAEQGLVPTSTEEEHLLTAKDLADRIERLQKLVARDGESRKLKDGRVVMHPALAEIRQCESVLTRVVANIQTMETPAKDVKKQRAAESRWRTHNVAKLEQERKRADPYSS